MCVAWTSGCSQGQNCAAGSKNAELIARRQHTRSFMHENNKNSPLVHAKFCFVNPWSAVVKHYCYCLMQYVSSTCLQRISGLFAVFLLANMFWAASGAVCGAAALASSSACGWTRHITLKEKGWRGKQLPQTTSGLFFFSTGCVYTPQGKHNTSTQASHALPHEVGSKVADCHADRLRRVQRQQIARQGQPTNVGHSCKQASTVSSTHRPCQMQSPPPPVGHSAVSTQQAAKWATHRANSRGHDWCSQLEPGEVLRCKNTARVTLAAACAGDGTQSRLYTE